MSAYINISIQGTVYFGRVAHDSVKDDDIVQLYSSMLVGVKRESCFDVLYSKGSREWRQQDDIVKPFHDCRQIHIASIWTFDLDADILRCDKEYRNRWIPLDLVRQRPITRSDFKSYESPITPEPDLKSIFRPPYWKLSHKVEDLQRLDRHKAVNLYGLDRHKAFVSRILTDFALQWKHILGGRYNNSTFRKLACAIIKIVTLDFTVEEITLSRQGPDNFLVWIHDVPEWDPLSGHIIRVGSTSIVICQHFLHATTLIKDDCHKRTIPREEDGSTGSLIYLVFSVREIILCRANSERATYTEPKRLLDGAQPLSPDAIDLLLEATETRPLTNFMDKLPIELQEMILDNVSAGPIERAKVGCILNAGSIFTWKRGNRNIAREEFLGDRMPETPVESHICFGNSRSGLAYK